jgi:hypothetical protein
MKFRIVPLVLAALCAFQACLVENMRAPQFVFEVSDVTVPADATAPYGTGVRTVTALVPVRCTENWSAIIVDAETAPWLSIASQDGSNPVGADVTGNLVLSCAFNDDYAKRIATLRLVTVSGETRDVTVTQEAKSDRVAIDGETAFTLSAESEADIKVKLLSNRDWTAEVPEGLATVTPAEGTGDAIVTIKAKPNYNCEEGSVTTVTFRAGEKTAEVTITRPADVPFIAANAVEVLRNYLPSTTEGVLRFNCNQPWKAEILSSNIRDFSLGALEGEGGMDSEIPFTMAVNDSQESLKAEVKLSLVSDPKKNVTLTVNQWTGFTITVDLHGVTSADACPLQPVDESVPQLPFSSGFLNSGNSQYDYELTGTPYIFGLNGDYLVVRNGDIRFNASSAGYIKFPAVEGYRLAYVEITTAATNKTFSVGGNPDGSVVIGAKKTLPKDAKGIWEFNDTEFNTSYYLIISSGSSRLSDWVLLYVK